MPDRHRILHSHRVRIRIAGVVAPRWVDRFDQLELSSCPGGDTLLRGQLTDQTALFGLIRTLESSGVSLISIATCPSEPPAR